MKRLILSIILLLPVAPTLAQGPEVPAWLKPQAMEMTDPLPDGSASLTDTALLPFMRVLSLTTVTPAGGTLHQQLLKWGLCVEGTSCDFAAHVNLRQNADSANATQVMVLRYVFLSERARIEGVGCYWKNEGRARYWQRQNGSWVEFGAGTPEYLLEESFVSGTWNFVVENSKE